MKKYIDLEDMVNLNCSTVLDIISRNSALSRKDIVRLSGLSWGGMTKIVNKLLENGYITETASVTSKSARGRAPSVLSINAAKNLIIGFDLNQMGLNAVVMNLSGEILRGFTAPGGFGSKEELVSESVSFLKKIFQKYHIIAIGVAMQGIVDRKNGICESFFGRCQPDEIPIKKLLEDEFGVKVFVEHDPDCILLAHNREIPVDNTVLLRIDRGVGMAVSIEGKAIKGKGVLEIEHNCAVAEGTLCTCGRRGCLGAYVRKCYDKNGDISPEGTKELIPPLAITVQNLINLFNAERVILTGDLMEHAAYFEDEFRSYLDKSHIKPKPDICPLADYAVRGAGLTAIKKSIAYLEI